MFSKERKDERKCNDKLSHNEREAPELEEVADDEEKDVKDLLALGGAAREEDDDEGDDTEYCDGEVERVVVALPELLLAVWGSGGQQLRRRVTRVGERGGWADVRYRMR